MFSKEFLTNEIPALNCEDSGTLALSLMEDYKLKHLPVLKDGKFSFIVSETDIFRMGNPEDSIENLSIFAPYAKENTSIFDVIGIINQYRLSILPVVNETGEYQGVITLNNLLEKIGELCNISKEGAIIAVELNPQEYVLSHIIHLVEQNNAKVSDVFTFMDEKTSKLILLLKIDLEDASNVVRSLERFNYPVRYYAQKQMLSDETAKDRFDELMFYLGM
ncbi:CBS domain-containing protein [Dysgonomonadaceae bacterium PH5-43]|nr:CBS domain-containing protein [Dysgonomonadaceae bacterium PH5-43]